MLDLAEGDWVETRDGSYCKIVKTLNVYFMIKEAVLNGFNNVLWYENFTYVEKESGRQYRDKPSNMDIKYRITWRSGFWSDKPIRHELEKFS